MITVIGYSDGELPVLFAIRKANGYENLLHFQVHDHNLVFTTRYDYQELITFPYNTIKPGKFIKLVIVCEQNRFKFFVNDIAVGFCKYRTPVVNAGEILVNNFKKLVHIDYV